MILNTIENWPEEVTDLVTQFYEDWKHTREDEELEEKLIEFVLKAERKRIEIETGKVAIPKDVKLETRYVRIRDLQAILKGKKSD